MNNNMKNYSYALTQASILALAGSFIFTTMAIRDMNGTISHLVKQDTSLVQFDTSTVELLTGMTDRIKWLEARELDLSFRWRQNLITWLTFARYFWKVADNVYKVTGYSMIMPEYKVIDDEWHIDWNHLDVVFQRDAWESTIGYSREYSYIVCQSNDDGVGSRDWASLADELHDGVIKCAEGEYWTWKLRPNFERVVNRIISNTKFEW